MKWTSTLIEKFVILLISFLSITLINSKSYAQARVYANQVTIGTAAGDHVDNPNNALGADPTKFATINSYGGGLLGLGAYNGQLELKFPGTLAAGQTSYVRIDFSAGALNALLGGNLGTLLANVLGSVVLGNHYFNIEARNGTTTVLSGSSSTGFSDAALRLVQDANGFYYLAVTPNQAYDRIYINDITNALLLSGNYSMNVYSAFYTAPNADPCVQAFATGYEGSGLTLDLLGLGKAGVTNAQYAIDADPTNYSQLSLGALGVAGSISQNIYFENLSNAGDDFNVKMQLSPGLLNLGVANNITVTAYNGTTQVYSANTGALLSLDLLGLLNNGQAVSVPFTSPLPFDRVKVTFSSLLNVNLTQTVYLYSVIRTAGRPTFTAPSSNAVNACYGSTASLTATTSSANQLVWYDVATGGTALGTVAYNAAFVTPALTANKTYYVAAKKIGCVDESARVPVNITVNPAITFATTTLKNATAAAVYSKQITAATGGSPGFTYALATGSSLPTGLALSSAGLIGGTATTAGTYTFSITAKDTQGCTVTVPYTLIVNGALTLPTANLPNGITGVLYAPQTLPQVTGGNGPYVYSAPTLPPGLSFDPVTHIISGTPTKPGTYSIPVTVTDADGNTVSTTYSITVKDPLTLPTTNLADGTVGTVYPTQVIPPAAGGDIPYTYTATGLPPGLSFNAQTREITGTPTQSGNYTVAVTAKDAGSQTISTNYSIKVLDPLVLPAKVLGSGTVGVAYNTETIPSATGGTGPYTYAAVSLPPGLSFNNTTLQITGTPTQSGSYNTTVTVTDASGKTAAQTYNIRVSGVIVLPGASLPGGIVGTVYPTQTLPGVSSGGTAPYTYTATGLPPGLTFDPATRQISGTPTTGGTYTVTQVAKDANGVTTSTDYTLVVDVADPVVSNVTICAGTSATLTVSNAQNGVTYNWYASAGNTPIFTGPVYQTGVLNASATYYVQASSGSASSNRIQVSVNVTPAPALPVVTTNNQIINAGQTTVLQATATSGNTIKWYGTATGGVALANGPSFTTPALSTTTTYYVETQGSSGCVSTSRTPVTVTVITGNTNPNCNAAKSQETGIDGLLCLLCSIDGPGNSTDADLNNFTKINLAVGVGATGYQRLIFPAVGAATDSIRLDLETPTGLLDLNVLGGITVTVLNGTTVVSTYPLNSSLIDLRLLAGNRFKATVLAGGPYDRVEVRFGAVVAALSNLSIYGAEIIYPNPTLTSGNQTICSGSTANLTAAPNGGTTLAWYSDATGGTLLSNTNNYTTPALTSTTTYYIEISKAGCANPQRLPVTVTVTPAFVTPVITGTGTVCPGSSAVLAVTTPQTGVTYNWYTTSTGGTPVFTGPSFTTPAITANVTYYVEGVNGSCISPSRTAAAITVSPALALPQVQVSASTINPGQTVILTATSTDSNVNFNWYSSATATTPVYSGSTYVTPPLSTTTTYYLETKSTVTGCVSPSRVQVTITVNTGGVPNPVPCEAPTTQTNDVINGIALLSGVFNPELAIDNDTQTGSSLLMPVGLLGASVYQRVGFTSLSNVGDTVRVLLSAPGKLLSLGVLSNIQLSTYNGNTSNNDAMTLNNSLIQLQLLSGNSQALISFVPTAAFDKVQVSLNSGVAGVLTSVNLNYVQRVVVAPTLSASTIAACATQTVQLQVSNPNPGITYTWYDATGSTVIGTGATITSPVLTATTKFFVEAKTASGCTSYKTPLNVTVAAAPNQPVLASSTVNACTGAGVVLTVSNPQTGVIYIWKDNSNTVVQSGPASTYTTPPIIGTTTYTVTAQNSCDVNSAATTATVNIGTPTPPVITPSAVTVTNGSSALLTATSTITGATFSWYATDPSVPGAVVISTPTNGLNGTYVTDPLSNPGATAITKTFWVTSSSLTCTSAAATVVVTILPSSAPQSVPCEAATTELHDVDGLISVLAGVDNPGFAVDNDINTGSTLRMPVGVAASVYQRAIFTGLSTIGDKVRLKIVSPNTLLNLAVVPSIQVTTYNGANSNNDTKTLSNPLIQLQILPGNTEALVEFTPTSVFDRVELRLNSGLLGALTSINFNYAQRVLAAPVVPAVAVNICAGLPATLSVSNPVTDGSVTYKWYIGTATTSAASGATFNTDPALAVGAYDYYVTATRNGCESAKTKVTVTVWPGPDAPVALSGNPSKTCANVPVTLGVTQVTGVSFNWYDALTGGNVLASNSSTYTTPASLAPGVYNFYVEAVNSNSCVSTLARTKITLTVNPPAVAADITVAGATDPLCKGSTAQLTASSTTVTNPVFTWYSDAALTSAVFTGPVFAPVVNATTTYYVTVSGDNKCANNAANAKVVTLTVNPPAVAADITIAGASTPYCLNAIAQLTASSTTVTNPVFRWYRDAALTDLAFTGAAYSPVITAATTFYVTVSGDNKCANAAADAKVVSITVNPPATAADLNVSGNDKPFCAGSTAQLTASSVTVINPVFTWYSDAALTTPVFTGPVYSPVVNATTTYYVTVRGANKCENAAADAKVITLNVNPPATAADINVTGATKPLCAGTIAQLNATTTTVNNPVFTWYSDAALTNAVFTGATYTPVINGNITYYVTVRGDNRCENSAANAKVVSITINPPATAADLSVSGAGNALCVGATAQLTATSTTVINPIFTWYSDAALSNVLFTGAIYSPAVHSATTYYVTVRGDNRCENAAVDALQVNININPPATAADITVSGADKAFCNGVTALLTASSTTVTNPVFTWYSDAALTNAVSFSATYSPVVTASTTYYVTVKGDNKCPNATADAKAVTLTINPPATAADVSVSGAANAFCINATAELTASSTTVTNPIFTWYNDAALSNAVFTGAVYKPVVNGATTYYVTVKGDNKCENAAANARTVTITVNPPATAADITVTGAEKPFCAGATVQLTAGSTTVNSPVFTWYSDAALTTALFTGAVYSPVVNATTTYYVTVSGTNKCANAAADAKVVVVNINPPASAADLSVSGNAAAYCAGSTAQLTASSTTVTNPVFSWYSDAALTSKVFTGAVYSPVVNANITYYVTVKGDNRCESTAATAQQVSITVNTPATAADLSVSGASTAYCAGATAQLTASSTTVTNPVFTWYNDAALTSKAFTGAVYSPVVNANTTYYVTVKGDNKCENTAANALVVNITVNPLPETPVVSSTGLNVCMGDNTVVSIQNPKAGITYNWYATSARGAILYSGSSYSITGLSSTTDYYVEAVSAAGCGNASGLVKVTVTVSPKPTAPAVTAAAVTTCTGSTAVLSVFNPQNGFTYNWYATATAGTILGTGSSFTTPAVNANTTFYVEAVSAAGCASTSRTAVNVVISAPPAAPASVSASVNPLCSGSNAALSVNNPDPALTYRWYAVQTGGTVLTTGTTYAPAVTATSTYYVESVSAAGCSSSTRTPVTVTVLPVLAAPAVIVQSVTATSVTFAWAPVNGATIYEVSTDGGQSWKQPSSGPSGLTHVISGLKPTNVVNIRVRAKGQLDCQTSAASSSDGTADNPLKNGVFVPNTFTPNGDGNNDVFYAYGNTIAKLKMRIYNQWGQFIFESQNIQTGWDGTYKGQLQPTGVYVYLLDLEFTDGTTSTKKGTITLLR
ncbi:Ig-like domain-containing protein [Pedobacter nutrimenti]|uniref:Gliding motility-associated-like protein n=1 Tax=Pedobacter nutrimenti TaxID=1241337 RepID=A0A318U904_9SPHI|nr:putative Ig domain-containing protein [Pedobacter nutrimenti]PYF70025.1 gliding motility-associated-like protein [Pedobacter nutrimenti]